VSRLATADILLHADALNAKHLFHAFEYLTHCYIKATIMSLYDKYKRKPYYECIMSAIIIENLMAFARMCL